MSSNYPNNPYLIVVPRVSEHTLYDVYIDGKQVNTYTFSKKSEEYSFKKITIKVKKGAIKIQKDLCWAMYPTDDGNYIPWKQNDFCDWFVGINCRAEKWYYGKNTLDFYHIYLQGPSYFKGTIPIFDYNPILCADPIRRKQNSLLLKKKLKL